MSIHSGVAAGEGTGIDLGEGYQPGVIVKRAGDAPGLPG